MSGLDINLFRVEKGGNPEIVRQSCIKRNKDPKVVDEIIVADKHWRYVKFQLDQIKKEWNAIGKEMGEKKRVNKEDPCVELLEKKAQNEARQAYIVKEEKLIKSSIDKLVNSVGNIVHESVPVSNNEDNNRVERTWGVKSELKITGKRGAYHHHEVLEAIGGYDPERGQKIAGHRGYFLKGPGVMLNLALVQYGLQFLAKRGYTAMQPPFFMKKEVMAETCQLSDFDDQLYQVKEGKTSDDEFYLIATSEQPISGFHRGETMDDKQLPIRYSGFSSCFRKEAGAHGKDNWGIFRVHQFEKIEQFIICKPEESWAMHEEMIKVSEEFYQSLELPYQVISIVSGALNDAAAKKYDLEAWFPGYGAFRELVSCSNCTDYQSRNLDIKCGQNTKEVMIIGIQGERRFVHMLNGTLTATERTLCCILENYQTETGVKVPTVLQQYVGTDFIPYIEEKKEEKKGKGGKVHHEHKERKEEKKEGQPTEVPVEEKKPEVKSEEKPAE